MAFEQQHDPPCSRTRTDHETSYGDIAGRSSPRAPPQLNSWHTSGYQVLVRRKRSKSAVECHSRSALPHDGKTTPDIPVPLLKPLLQLSNQRYVHHPVTAFDRPFSDTSQPTGNPTVDDLLLSRTAERDDRDLDFQRFLHDPANQQRRSEQRQIQHQTQGPLSPTVPSLLSRLTNRQSNSRDQTRVAASRRQRSNTVQSSPFERVALEPTHTKAMDSVGSDRRNGTADLVDKQEPAQRVKIWRPSGVQSSDAYRIIQRASATLRERPSRKRFASSSSMQSQAPSTLVPSGEWEDVTITLKDANLLYVIDKRSALCPLLRTSTLKPTDVRIIHPSVLGRRHVLGFLSVSSAFAGNAGRSHHSDSSVRSQSNGQWPPAPVFICFPDMTALRQWVAILRACGVPDIYGTTESISKGGTHRWHRKLEVLITDFRPLQSADCSAEPAPQPAVPAKPTSARPITQSELDSRQTSLDLAARDLPLSQSACLSRTVSIDSRLTSPQSSSAGHDSSADEDDEHSRHQQGAERVSTKHRASKLPTSRRLSRQAQSVPLPAHRNLSCAVVLDGVIVGRTTVQPCSEKSGTVAWSSQAAFAIDNIADPRFLRINVNTVSKTGKVQRRTLLGVAELPVETMARNEPLEGWFPVWSCEESDFGDSGGVEDLVSPPSPISGECIGEIRGHITLSENVVLPLRKYREIERIVQSPECYGLLNSLSGDEQVLGTRHLIDVFVSSDSCVDRICEFVDIESSDWLTERREQLFRGSGPLSRIMEKFQRLHCHQWLEQSVGGVVRTICEEAVEIDVDAIQQSIQYQSLEMLPELSGSSSTMQHGMPGSSDSLAASRDYGSQDISAIRREVEKVQQLIASVWDTIYAHRYRCPDDLRHILSHIRATVNASMPDNSRGASSVGMQGVGNFVFLRFLLPAVASPHAYGLVAMEPSSEVAETLKLISKVILVLANKTPVLDNQRKMPWLSHFQDFLSQQATAMDDYIAAISTVGRSATERNKGKRSAVRSSYQADMDADDQTPAAIERFIDLKSKSLPPIHRESIARAPYYVDRPLALASFVTFALTSFSPSRMEDKAMGAVRGSNEPLQVGLVDRLCNACRDVERLAGYCADRAGFDPGPLRLSGFVCRPAAAAAAAAMTTEVTPHQIAGSQIIPQAESIAPFQDPRSTQMLSEAENQPVQSRRRATVSSAVPRPFTAQQGQTGLSIKSHLPCTNVGAPRSPMGGFFEAGPAIVPAYASGVADQAFVSRGSPSRKGLSIPQRRSSLDASLSNSLDYGVRPDNNDSGALHASRAICEGSHRYHSSGRNLPERFSTVRGGRSVGFSDPVCADTFAAAGSAVADNNKRGGRWSGKKTWFKNPFRG